MTMWEDAEPVLRQRAYDTIATLLVPDEAMGPLSIRGDAYFARLIGLEDEVVGDLRIDRPKPQILMPLAAGRRSLMVQTDGPYRPTIRTARYDIQPPYCIVPVSAEYAPPGVRPGPDFMVRLVYLLYRRTLSR